MGLSRYSRTPIIAGGSQYGTTQASSVIRSAALSGALSTVTRVAHLGERLDTIAGQVYGDGLLWWVIAAASGIGWGLQVPPGTQLLVPTRLDQVAEVLR